jgi:hypothetical protein
MNTQGPLVATIEAGQGSQGVGPPKDAEAYLSEARELLRGVEILAEQPLSAAVALANLAAQITECVLKSFLVFTGASSELRDHDLRHNIDTLWEMAHSRGLAITQKPPAWAAILSSLHNKPYLLRYPMGQSGMVTPGVDPMVSDLRRLIEAVGNAIR